MMIGSSQQQLARALLILKNNVRSFVHSSNVCVAFWLFGCICGARSIFPNQSLIVNIGTYHVCGKNEPLNRPPDKVYYLLTFTGTTDFQENVAFFQLGCFYFAKHLLSYILLTYKLFWVFSLKKYFQLLDLRFEIGLSDSRN